MGSDGPAIFSFLTFQLLFVLLTGFQTNSLTAVQTYVHMTKKGTSQFDG